MRNYCAWEERRQTRGMEGRDGARVRLSGPLSPKAGNGPVGEVARTDGREARVERARVAEALESAVPSRRVDAEFLLFDKIYHPALRASRTPRLSISRSSSDFFCPGPDPLAPFLQALAERKGFAEGRENDARQMSMFYSEAALSRVAPGESAMHRPPTCLPGAYCLCRTRLGRRINISIRGVSKPVCGVCTYPRAWRAGKPDRVTTYENRRPN